MLWWRNQPMHAATLPIGGEQVSSALATILRTPRQSAEMLKRSHGALLDKYSRHTRIPLPSTGNLPDRYLSSSDMVEQIAACYQKFFTSINKEFHRIGLAQIPGLAEMAGAIFNCPVRVYIPPPVSGLDEHLQNDAGMVTTLGLFQLQQNPVNDYVWAKEEKDGIISSITNFLKRYL